MKKKKLKKKVVQLSAEFDGNVDEDARGDMFEKYLVKVKNVVIDDKYVSICNDKE